jgi:hypothetical protein
MQTINTVNPTILLAIELSASTWLVAARVPGLEKPRLHRIDGGDMAALLALISSLRARAARGLDATIGGPSGHTNLPHPSSREGHRSIALWSSTMTVRDDTVVSKHNN